jgi:hypothetical protein
MATPELKPAWAGLICSEPDTYNKKRIICLAKQFMIFPIS